MQASIRRAGRPSEDVWRSLDADERRRSARERMFTIGEENAAARERGPVKRKPLKLIRRPQA